jgi:hypothetical protein
MAVVVAIVQILANPLKKVRRQTPCTLYRYLVYTAVTCFLVLYLHVGRILLNVKIRRCSPRLVLSHVRQGTSMHVCTQQTADAGSLDKLLIRQLHALVAHAGVCACRSMGVTTWHDLSSPPYVKGRPPHKMCWSLQACVSVTCARVHVCTRSADQEAVLTAAAQRNQCRWEGSKAQRKARRIAVMPTASTYMKTSSTCTSRCVATRATVAILPAICAVQPHIVCATVSVQAAAQ